MSDDQRVRCPASTGSGVHSERRPRQSTSSSDPQAISSRFWQMGAMLPIFSVLVDGRNTSYLSQVLQIGAMLPIWGGMSTEKHISDRLGSSIGSPCTKPIWDSSENSSQAKPFITNQSNPSPVRLQPCHKMHSISYLRQQMQRCIPFPIPGNRCRISSLYNYAVSPALDRTSSTINFFLWITVHFR